MVFVQNQVWKKSCQIIINFSFNTKEQEICQWWTDFNKIIYRYFFPCSIQTRQIFLFRSETFYAFIFIQKLELWSILSLAMYKLHIIKYLTEMYFLALLSAFSGQNFQSCAIHLHYASIDTIKAARGSWLVPKPLSFCTDQ